MSKSLFSAPRYSGVAIGLHWLLAIAIVANFCVGLYMTDLAMSPQRLKLFNWHKWAGITILAFSALRLLWRITHRPPPLPRTMASWQVRASHTVHTLLYVFFFAVPISGWLYSNAAGFPVVVFGVIPLPDLVAKNRELSEVIKPLHGWLAFALAGAVSLHVLAAIKHQWIDRDQLLSRMMPRRTK
jgi:cytochrome b561